MDFNNFSDVKKIKTKKSAKVDLGYNHERGRGGRGNGEGLFQFCLITTCYLICLMWRRIEFDPAIFHHKFQNGKPLKLKMLRLRTVHMIKQYIPLIKSEDFVYCMISSQNDPLCTVCPCPRLWEWDSTIILKGAPVAYVISSTSHAIFTSNEIVNRDEGKGTVVFLLK